MEAARDYLAKNFTQVDFIFSYSSLEHDGLGRYGDPINPFADLVCFAYRVPTLYCINSCNAGIYRSSSVYVKAGWSSLLGIPSGSRPDFQLLGIVHVSYIVAFCSMWWWWWWWWLPYTLLASHLWEVQNVSNLVDVGADRSHQLIPKSQWPQDPSRWQWQPADLGSEEETMGAAKSQSQRPSVMSRNHYIRRLLSRIST